MWTRFATLPTTPVLAGFFGVPSCLSMAVFLALTCMRGRNVCFARFVSVGIALFNIDYLRWRVFMWTCFATLSATDVLAGFFCDFCLPLVVFRAFRFKLRRCICFGRMVHLGTELFAID
jgi:hypothetical protein